MFHWVLIGCGAALIAAELAHRRPVPRYRVDVHRDEPGVQPELVRLADDEQ